MRPIQTTPYMLHDEEGQRLKSLGALVLVKATSEQTGGVFNLFDVTSSHTIKCKVQDIHQGELL